MKPTTRIAIAALLHSAGQMFVALAAEFNNGGEAQTENTQPEPQEKATRTRKPKEDKAAAATTEATTEPAAETPAATNGASTLPTDEQYAHWRKVIEPLVQGEGSTADLRAAVKNTVLKYSPNGGLKTMDPKHGPAFERDIAALSY